MKPATPRQMTDFYREIGRRKVALEGKTGKYKSHQLVALGMAVADALGDAQAEAQAWAAWLEKTNKESEG